MHVVIPDDDNFLLESIPLNLRRTPFLLYYQENNVAGDSFARRARMDSDLSRLTAYFRCLEFDRKTHI